MQAHILSIYIDDNPEKPKFPFIALTVSGGHTQLVVVNSPFNFAEIGTTLDDAAGEAFDKCAKAMGLGYPGGPAIEAVAKSGDSKSINLPRPLQGTTNCHFSFSGLKTALANKLQQLGGPDTAPIADLAASLQAAITDCLADRTQKAMLRFRDEFPPAEGQQPVLVIAGGVAANRYIFNRMQHDADTAGFRLLVPPAKLCTDNAAMIAWAALERLEAPNKLDFAPRPRWPLDPNASPPPGRGVRQ